MLAATYRRAAVDTLAFHIALFEVSKGVSFGPGELHVDDRWLPFLTPELLALWQTVVRRVWAHWRYEHGLDAYEGPVPPPVDQKPGAELGLPLPAGPADHLWLCGGGKDSLLASHLLDTLGERYDAPVYAHSTYGRSRPQIELIDRIVHTSKSAAEHRIYMYDTATDLPSATCPPTAASARC